MNSNWKLLPAALLAAVLALAGCGGGGDDMTPMPTPEEQCTAGGGTYVDGNCKSAEQVAAEGAIAAAYMAAAGLDATSDDAAVSAAESLIMAAQAAIAALSMDEEAENAAVLATAESLAQAWRAALTAQAEADAAKTAEEQRLAAEEAERARQAAEEARMAAEAMAATAAKLYAGIYAPAADATGTAVGDVHAAYNADETAITVTIGGGTTAIGNDLSADEDAVVAALAGWEGMRFTAEPAGDGGTYEAHVYSHVGDPTEGAVFNVAYTLNAADAATNPGELPLTTTATSLADQAAINAEVDSSLFDQTAGTKEFEKGANLTRLIIPGSFSGVPGNYYCLPAASSTCAVRVAAAGFELGVTADADNAFTLGSWTFKPTDPEQKLMNTPDNMYASYGWWLHKSEDDSTYTASAFHDYKADGNPVGADGLTNLNGTATYSGGAAGKYALSSTTGGTNDAGHFTADDVSLEANFTEDMITGTINGFTGADGQSRNWSVKLNSAGMGNNGAIVGTADGEDFGDTNPYVGTVWTIGETAADAAGQWSGQMHELGDDGVPGIATGTFYSEFGRDGRMVGAFGANQD